jgi:hypothetical protein
MQGNLLASASTLKKVPAGNWQKSSQRSQRHRDQNRNICQMSKQDESDRLIESNSGEESNPSEFPAAQEQRPT